MRKLIGFMLGALLCVTLFHAEAKGEDVGFSFNILAGGISTSDTSGSVTMIEFESLLNKGLSLFVRAGTLSFEYEDVDWKEEGDASGLDVGVRWYTAKRGFGGFYMGGNIGVWGTDADWIDKTEPPMSIYREGTYSATSLKIEYEIGGRIPLGTDVVSLSPSFHLGSYISADDECKYANGAECTEEAGVGPYAFFALALGFAF